MRIEPWPIDRPLPAAMTDRQFMSVLQKQKSRFYTLKASGQLDRFRLVPPVGDACWSGRLIDAWLKREHAATTKHFSGTRKLRRTA